MTPGQIAGWVGGVAGGAIGLAGGIVGTWFSVRNTNGPRERAFMVRAAALCWAAGLVFLALLLLLPSPYRFLMWLPYGIVLPLAIRYGNRRQQAVREAEAHTSGEGAHGLDCNDPPSAT